MWPSDSWEDKGPSGSEGCRYKLLTSCKKAQRGSEGEALSPPSAATLDEADLRPLWPNWWSQWGLVGKSLVLSIACLSSLILRHFPFPPSIQSKEIVTFLTSTANWTNTCVCQCHSAWSDTIIDRTTLFARCFHTCCTCGPFLTLQHCG